MKRQIRILLICFIVLFCVSLSACGFVNYIKYDAQTDSEAFNAALDDYINRIRALSNEEYYRDDERRLYISALLDAENELRECKTLGQLEEVFERHSAAILAIPTDIELTVAYLCEQLCASFVTDNYRDAERAAIEQMLAEYISKMQAVANATEGEKLVMEFKTLLAQVKTNAQYELEEMIALKNEYSGFGDRINYALYPTESHSTLIRISSDFEEQLRAVNSLEECQELVALYENKLSDVLTIEQILSIDREVWRREWHTPLLDFAQKYSIDVDSAAQCLSVIQSQNSAEAADRVAASFMLSYAEELGETAIEDIRNAAKIYVYNIVTLGDYRDTEVAQIKDMVTAYLSQIESAQNLSQICTLARQAEAQAALVPTNDQMWEREDSEFSSHMQTKYANVALTPPANLKIASSMEELARIIDYYAFYQIDGQSFERATFRVNLDFSHKYSDYVIKDVYWYCELLRSAVGIGGYFETDTSNLVITLEPYALASVSNTDKPVTFERYNSVIEYTGNTELYDRADDFDAFLYYEKYEGKYVAVWNSQQLWYALEHEYIPLPVEGSPADIVLARAKEILRDIIKDGMTIEQKVFAIYAWYADNVKYDHGIHEYVNIEGRENYPDRMVATLNSFHAEGALLDNLAVCCSYAKSCLILMRLEGIEAYRVILHLYDANAIDNFGREDYGSHAVIALRASDGKFYYCDVEQTSGSEIYEKYFQILVTAKEQAPYHDPIDKIWNHLDYGEEFPMELLWSNVNYNGKCVFFEDEQALRAMVDEFLAAAEPKTQLDVFSIGKTDFDVISVLDSYENISFAVIGGVGDFYEYLIKAAD